MEVKPIVIKADHGARLKSASGPRHAEGGFRSALQSQVEIETRSSRSLGHPLWEKSIRDRRDNAYVDEIAPKRLSIAKSKSAKEAFNHGTI